MSRQRATVAIGPVPAESLPGVQEALARVPGILRVYLNAPIEMAYVEYDEEAVTPPDLLAAIAGVGLHPGELSRR